MAWVLFTILLAIVAIAATAAGFVNEDLAVFWWIVAAVFAVATVIAFIWERKRAKKLPPPPSPFLDASGDTQTELEGNQFDGYDGAILKDRAKFKGRKNRFRRGPRDGNHDA